MSWPIISPKQPLLQENQLHDFRRRRRPDIDRGLQGGQDRYIGLLLGQWDAGPGLSK